MKTFFAKIYNFIKSLFKFDDLAPGEKSKEPLRGKIGFFIILILIITAIALVYICKHYEVYYCAKESPCEKCDTTNGKHYTEHSGGQIVKLTPQQYTDILKIISDGKAEVDAKQKEKDSIIAQNEADTNKTVRDTSNAIFNRLPGSLTLDTKEKVRCYLKICYPDLMVGFLDDCFGSLGFSSLEKKLPEVTFYNRSFFWLNDERKYWEVLCWALFGVLCNLLYSYSEAMRKNDVSKYEIPVYFAKLVYAPIITLILIWGFNRISASDAKIEDNSLFLLISSFILGFFSGRALDLLNKLKDVFFPEGKGTDEKKEDSKSSTEKTDYAIKGKVQSKEGYDFYTGNNFTMFLLNVKTSEKLPLKLEENYTFEIAINEEGEYKIIAEYNDGAVIMKGETTVTISKESPVKDDLEIILKIEGQ